MNLSTLQEPKSECSRDCCSRLESPGMRCCYSEPDVTLVLPAWISGVKQALEIQEMLWTKVRGSRKVTQAVFTASPWFIILGQYQTVQYVLTQFCATHDLEIKSETFLTCQSIFSSLFKQFAHSSC